MSETLPEDRSPEPITVGSIAADLRALGVAAGSTTLVHGSLSSLGWVCGGPPAVVDALQRVVGEEIPPYRPAVTPTQGVGAIAECFRSYPGVRRSAHPQHSFAAWGAEAAFVTESYAYDNSLGEQSPLARVYDLDGDVLFLGTTHATNTSLPLAEYRTDPDVEMVTNAGAVLVDGDCEWIEWVDIAVDDEDFPECGAAFEDERPGAFETGQVGVGDAKLIDQRSLVDFGVEWFERNRE